jgi:hypothetical protein
VTDPDDNDDLNHWVEVMNMANGYGAAFNYKGPQDKAIVEIGSCREWCNSVSTEFGVTVGDPEHNPNDPPDCYVSVEGKRLGVELVQLVEPEHKRRATNGETPYAGQLFIDMQWSKERLESRLNEVLTEKAKKYEKNGQCVDVLLIHTDETWLTSIQVSTFLAGVEFMRYPNIGSVFLMLNYEPGRHARHWPVFWLYGNLGDIAAR